MLSPGRRTLREPPSVEAGQPRGGRSPHTCGQSGVGTGFTSYQRCVSEGSPSAEHVLSTCPSQTRDSTPSPPEFFCAHQISSTLRCTCRRYVPSAATALPSCTMFAIRSYLVEDPEEVTSMRIHEGGGQRSHSHTTVIRAAISGLVK